MWKIMSSGDLGHRWLTLNIWDKSKGEEEDYFKHTYSNAKKMLSIK